MIREVNTEYPFADDAVSQEGGFTEAEPILGINGKKIETFAVGGYLLTLRLPTDN